MKAIINGKKYDTNTAKEIYYYDNIRECYGHKEILRDTDIGYHEESLYKKRTGEFFLRTKGCQCGGSFYEPERLRPISEKEAKERCEKHLSVEEYEELFGEVEE